MKKLTLIISFAAITFSIIFISQSCKKNSENPQGEVHDLTFTLPGLEFKNDMYYSIEDNMNHINFVFNKEIDVNSVAGNITFSDKSGVLNDSITIDVAGQKMYVRFNSNFHLNPGWRYLLKISQGFRSTEDDDFAGDTIIEFRTLSHHLFDLASGGKTASQRTLIACISDIHMGQQKAVDSGYCWFGDNKEALEQFLDMVIEKPVFKELVIMGDLFDEWMIPYSISPFDSTEGVTNRRQYFESIVSASTNSLIFDKLKAIASNPDILVTYFPGNHDMRITEDIFKSIIPGAQWKSDAVGLGTYSPASDILLEHGHRYDFFNCPHPLVNEGHILPPGFFVTRLYAQGYMTQGAPKKSYLQTKSSLEFDLAWDITMYELDHKYFSMNTDYNADIILMGGVDNYTAPFSYNGAKEMFRKNIEDNWDATQTQNKVPVQLKVYEALEAGISLHNLYTVAAKEYMEKSSPVNYKLVAFGHTHKATLEVYPKGSNYKSIYANSGTWINDACTNGHPSRTFLTIYPGDWTDSELDIVTYYQFNFNSTQNKYSAVRIKEESILK